MAATCVFKIPGLNNPKKLDFMLGDWHMSPIQLNQLSGAGIKFGQYRFYGDSSSVVFYVKSDATYVVVSGSRSENYNLRRSSYVKTFQKYGYATEELHGANKAEVYSNIRTLNGAHMMLSNLI